MAEKRPAFNFDPEWRITLATLVLVPVFVGLGFWQLDRAAEKAGLAGAFEMRQKQAPTPLESVVGQPASELAYLPVRVSGEFLPPVQFLLDNRIHQGRYGNEVVEVVKLADSGPLVAINRGWIAADASRRTLPAEPAVAGSVSFIGHIYVPPGKPYLLGEQVLEPGWPKRIQAVQIDLLASAVVATGPNNDGRALIENFFPYVVRIDPDQPGALEVDWQVINVSPAKHHGYAVQWFTMALALAVIFVFRSSNVWTLMTWRERTLV